VVNDSADVTSSGRSLHACGDRKKLGYQQLQAIGVDKVRGRSATRVNGPRIPKVPRCKSVVDFICQYGDLELNSLRDAQPMEPNTYWHKSLKRGLFIHSQVKLVKSNTIS